MTATTITNALDDLAGADSAMTAFGCGRADPTAVAAEPAFGTNLDAFLTGEVDTACAASACKSADIWSFTVAFEGSSGNGVFAETTFKRSLPRRTTFPLAFGASLADGSSKRNKSSMVASIAAVPAG